MKCLEVNSKIQLFGKAHIFLPLHGLKTLEKLSQPMYIWGNLSDTIKSFKMEFLWMFSNKIEEAAWFFDFTNIYIVDPILMKF